MKNKEYEKKLRALQAKLCELQEWVKDTGHRVIIVFEGRDTAGKGGTIRALTERVSPRVFRVVALPAPSDREKTQIYFQRYLNHFPAAGEIVVFDWSWYNRAGVEHVLGFCTKDQYEGFLEHCAYVEELIVGNGIQLIKLWLEVGQQEQERRMTARIDDPLRQWKLSPMDLESWPRWYEYSRARDRMFEATDTKHAPWHILRSDDKRRARLNCLAHVLKVVPYERIRHEKVKLPKRSRKHAYDDQASLRRRHFVPRCTERRSHRRTRALSGLHSYGRRSAWQARRATPDLGVPTFRRGSVEMEQPGAVLRIGVLLAVGGCAVGPTFTTPQATIAQGWRARNDPRVATETAADNLWWRAFGDAALERLMELAYAQNLPLQIAGLRIVEARAQLGIATGLQFPQTQAIVASAAANGLSKNTPVGSVLPNRGYGDYQVGFDAAWEIDFWGKYRRGVEAEAAGLLASVSDYAAAFVSLTAEVARTYVAVRTYEVLIQQARDNAKVQEEALEIARSRYQNGATSELDPSQATTLLESTRATIPQLRASLTQARNALCTLLGQPSGAVDALLAVATGIPRAPAKVAVGVPAEMLRRRPDIRSAELNAAAQCARIGVAKAELYPSFSLFGSIGLETTTVGGTTHKLFSTNSIFYAAGPRINWPFFNYGRLTNAVRVEDAKFQELLVSYRDTVLKAAQEVEDALAGFLDAQEALGFEQNAVTAAGRSVQLALVMYREGAADYQRVLDAQRALLEQQNNLAQTSSSVATNLIALYKALGGGWETRGGQPFVPEGTQSEMKARTNWGDLLSEPRAPETKQAPPPGKP